MKRIGASLPFAARGARAFTLIEVLVSCAVIGIVMFILLTTLSSSLTLWRTAEGNIAADREGRSANFLLAQDLANAVVLSNSSFWPKATSNSLSFLTLRPAEYQSDSNAVGDLCFVEYRVVQDTNTSNTNFLALTRNFVSSGETYEALKGGSFPPVPAANAQILAANIVPNRRVLYFNTEISDTHFAVLGVDGKPMTGSTAPPAMIDVTISTADEETVRSLDLTNKQVRKAGFYSFRQALRAP